jgi:hypothetical protein
LAEELAWLTQLLAVIVVPKLLVAPDTLAMAVLTAAAVPSEIGVLDQPCEDDRQKN